MTATQTEITALQLPHCRGTYVLLLKASQSAELQIGRFGQLALQPGYYFYVGSALGPGGIRSRAGRHLRVAKSLRWHIDYLRKYTRPIAVWYSCDTNRQETVWVEVMSGIKGLTTPMPGFGASDHRGQSHLFFSRRCPGLQEFKAALHDRKQPPTLIEEWRLQA